MALRPTWEVYLKLGEAYGREMDALMTFDEIGQILGVPRQRAYHECYVALGKLVYGLRQLLAKDLKRKEQTACNDFNPSWTR